MLRTTFCAIITFAFASDALADDHMTAGDVIDEAGSPHTAEDGGPRRWQVATSSLQMREAPLTDAPVIEILADGTILSNLGCTRIEDRVWCNVEPLRGGSRGFADKAFLRPARGTDGIVPMGADDSARRARKRDFDARFDIPCAQERGQELDDCAAGVARSVGGDATVVVTFSNGFSRTLYFVQGEFMSADATMSGSGTDTDWRMDGDLHHIRVDDQRYELRDVFVFGD